MIVKNCAVSGAEIALHSAGLSGDEVKQAGRFFQRRVPISSAECFLVKNIAAGYAYLPSIASASAEVAQPVPMIEIHWSRP